VYWDKARNGAWRAEIKVKGKKVYVGRFASERQAAQAWDRAALQYRGRGTRTNFEE
jgi:hypothetical protein